MAEPELKGPIRTAKFVHRAILAEAQWLQDSLLALMPDDTEQAKALSNRLSAFQDVLKTHEDTEDTALFPPLEARHSYVADTYEFDHDRHRQHGTTLASTLSNLVSASGGQRRELVKLAGEQAIMFNGYMALHIEKENELLFPLYDETFSFEEQMAHTHVVEEHQSQDAMARAGGWAFQRLDQPNREGFLRGMKDMLPAEAFNGMSQGLMRAIPATEWQELAQRLPGLPRAA